MPQGVERCAIGITRQSSGPARKAAQAAHFHVSRLRMSRLKTIATFTLGFAGWAAGAMAVSVFGFDQYERAWGRGPSYQVVLWIITVAAFVVAVGFSLGAKQLSVSVPWWKSYFLSAAYTLVFGALAYLSGYLGQFGVQQDFRFLFLALLSFFSSFLAAKLLTWHASAANPPLQGTPAGKPAAPLS